MEQKMVDEQLHRSDEFPTIRLLTCVLNRVNILYELSKGLMISNEPVGDLHLKSFSFSRGSDKRFVWHVNTKNTKPRAPSANRISPGTRSQRNVFIKGCCRNSALRAYQ